MHYITSEKTNKLLEQRIVMHNIYDRIINLIIERFEVKFITGN